MALIPQEDIDKVIEATDIVSIVGEAVPDLKQKGGRFLACCPFHKEKTPSFTVSPNEQFYHCFGCGEGGNVVTFVMKFYDMNFPEAMEFLADKANIKLKKTAGSTYSKSEKGRLMEACKLAAKFYHEQLTKVKSPGSDAARKYLGSRGMGSDVAKRWQLGYAPGNDQLVRYLLDKKFSIKDMIDANLAMAGRDGKAHDRFFNRVMFPICDVQGNVIAFGGRVMDDSQPKYLNSSENALFHKSKVMFGLDKAKQNMTAAGIAIVVEGYTDVIAMHEAGINYAVATLGTALTKQHIRMLNQHAKDKIVYLFDGDEAGQRAAERALNFIDQMNQPELYRQRAQLVALTLPDNMDPKEFIDAQGKDKLLQLIDTAQPLIQYGIDRKISQYDLKIPGNSARAASAALKILAPIKDSLIAKEYAGRIADATGIRDVDLYDQLASLKGPREYDDTPDKPQNSMLHAHHANQATNKISSLENELLCLIAKQPQVLKFMLELQEPYLWSNPSHQKLFDFMAQAFTQNPQIKSQEMLMRISQQNKQTANMLTKISAMFDFKDKPQQQCQFLLRGLKIHSLELQISQLKAQYAKMENGDEQNAAFQQIIQMQNSLNDIKSQVKELI